MGFLSQALHNVASICKAFEWCGRCFDTVNVLEYIINVFEWSMFWRSQCFGIASTCLINVLVWLMFGFGQCLVWSMFMHNQCFGTVEYLAQSMFWWGRCFGGVDAFVQSIFFVQSMLEKPLWVVSRQHYIMLHPFVSHSSGVIDVLKLSMF